MGHRPVRIDPRLSQFWWSWSGPVRRFNFCWSRSDMVRDSKFRDGPIIEKLRAIVYLTEYISNLKPYFYFLFLKMSQNFNVKMAGQLQCLKQNTDQLKNINCSKYNRLLWIESFPLNHSQTKPVRSFFESTLKFTV